MNNFIIHLCISSSSALNRAGQQHECLTCSSSFPSHDHVYFYALIPITLRYALTIKQVKGFMQFIYIPILYLSSSFFHRHIELEQIPFLSFSFPTPSPHFSFPLCCCGSHVCTILLTIKSFLSLSSEDFNAS